MGRSLFFIITFYVYAAGAMDSVGLASLCQSEKTFILVDIFKYTQPDLGYQAANNTTAMVDIDGDGAFDISHGDLVVAQLKAAGVNVVTYGLRAYDGYEITGAFGNIRYLTNKNKINNVGAVVMPVTYSRTAAQIGNELVGVSGMTRQEVLDLYRNSPDNYRAYWAKLPALQSVFVQMKLMQKDGIPVITPAGNRYGTSLNIVNLLGGPGIGATMGHSSLPAPYSDHFTETKIFRSGDIISVPVEGGIDINNDGMADIPDEQLSGQTSIVAQVESGFLKIKSAEEIKAEPRQPALIKTSEWLRITGVKDSEVITKYINNYGDLIYYPSEIPFFSSADGAPVFKPVQSHEAVMINMGTSFSIGNICSSSFSI